VPKRKIRGVILCEDRQQEVFIRQWLESKGFNTHRFRVEKCPSGRGAGEHYVRQRYPIEVQGMRRRINAPVGTSLVTMLDADTFAVSQRHRQLDRALEDAGLPRRQHDEKIALLVPKRNIETWIYYLRGEQVDEDSLYRKLDKPSDCIPDIKRLVNALATGDLITNAPSALKMAIDEMRRIV
jgi:hypothetical protein